MFFFPKNTRTLMSLRDYGCAYLVLNYIANILFLNFMKWNYPSNLWLLRRRFNVHIVSKRHVDVEVTSNSRLLSVTVWSWDLRIFTSSHSSTTEVTFLMDFFVGPTLLSDQTPQWFKSCSGYHVPCWAHSTPLHCLWQPWKHSIKTENIQQRLSD